MSIAQKLLKRLENTDNEINQIMIETIELVEEKLPSATRIQILNFLIIFQSWEEENDWNLDPEDPTTEPFLRARKKLFEAAEKNGIIVIDIGG